MKDYEITHYLPDTPFVAIRVDGRAFTTLTETFDKPFDDDFMEAMNVAANHALHDVIPQALGAYTQSDEISFIISRNTDIPFTGRMEKLLSLIASAVSVSFATHINQVKGTRALPIFDARVITVPDHQRLYDYITNRRMDARKNAFTMVTEHLYGRRALYKVPLRQRINMLTGTQYETVPNGFVNGRFVFKNTDTVVATREYTTELIHTWTHY